MLDPFISGRTGRDAGKGTHTWRDDILVHCDVRFQDTKVGIGGALERQGSLLLEDDIVDITGPGRHVVKGSVYILNTERGITLDGLACNGDVGPVVLDANVAHEKVQDDGLNAHGQRDLQVQRGLQSQLDRLGTRLHHRGIDENQIRLV